MFSDLIGEFISNINWMQSFQCTNHALELLVDHLRSILNCMIRNILTSTSPCLIRKIYWFCRKYFYNINQDCSCNVMHCIYSDTGEKTRVVYTVYEYDPLLDSSNMTIDDWILIAQNIKVLH